MYQTYLDRVVKYKEEIINENIFYEVIDGARNEQEVLPLMKVNYHLYIFIPMVKALNQNKLK